MGRFRDFYEAHERKYAERTPVRTILYKIFKRWSVGVFMCIVMLLLALLFWLVI